MILNQAQAEAVCRAMWALNDVSFNSGNEISFVGSSSEHMARYTIIENAGGEIEIIKGPVPLRREVETYANQAAFAKAYGLQ